MAKVLSHYNSLASVRDALTRGYTDLQTEDRINSMIAKWEAAPIDVNPFSEMRGLLELIRRVPPSMKRVKLMNTVVRTLGSPKNLATYLDMLRDATKRDGSDEQAACKQKLQNGKMHSVYGWCGNTLLVDTFDFPTAGTHEPLPGLEKKLGFPTALWNLTMHIWQPNEKAKGFPLANLDEGIVLEPPHSHPFDFCSYIVIGELHQSTYAQKDSIETSTSNTETCGHYDGITLQHVDGVWPPHGFRETCSLTTREHRIKLQAGDSYYMPCDWIHDVEISRNTALSQPAISLFLSSESLVMPHVYMHHAMAEAHLRNPDLKRTGVALPERAWHAKLKAVAAYLRGDSDLNLNSIVKHKGEYAFFHVKA
jgi:hypothetical protein